MKMKFPHSNPNRWAMEVVNKENHYGGNMFALDSSHLNTGSKPKLHECGNCRKTFKKLSKCGGCRNVLYCSVDCQKKDWPEHKKVCLLTRSKDSKDYQETANGKFKALNSSDDISDDSLFNAMLDPGFFGKVSDIAISRFGKKPTQQQLNTVAREIYPSQVTIFQQAVKNAVEIIRENDNGVGSPEFVPLVFNQDLEVESKKDLAGNSLGSKAEFPPKSENLSHHISMPSSPRIVNGKPKELRQDTDETIQMKVNELTKLVIKSVVTEGFFKKENPCEDLFFIIREYHKHNLEDPKIWNLVFEKLSYPMVSIPFGHGHTLTLPQRLWEFHSHVSNHQNFHNEDMSAEVIQTFLRCLQQCSSYSEFDKVLTQNNVQHIIKLAKRYQITWLYKECLEFNLIEIMGGIGYKVILFLNKWRWENDMNFIGKRLSKCILNYPEVVLHLNMVIRIINIVVTKNCECEEYSVSFSQGSKVTLPLNLWEAHSDYFRKMSTSSMNQNLNLQEEEDIPKESIYAFALCLANCNSLNTITLDNYFDLLKLSEKYQVLWLKEICAEFYKVYILSGAAQCKFTEDIGLYIKGIIREQTMLSVTVMTALDKLADQYQLIDLKLFANEFDLYVLRDGVLHVRLPDSAYMDRKEEKSLHLQKCLSMKNPWYLPKIELDCLCEISKEDFEVLNKIIQTTDFPIMVNFEANGGTIDFLITNLRKYPEIKNITIIIAGCSELKDFDPILKMIKEDTTLQSLSIGVAKEVTKHSSNYAHLFSFRSDVKEAMCASNSNLKEISLFHSYYKYRHRDERFLDLTHDWYIVTRQ